MKAKLIWIALIVAIIYGISSELRSQESYTPKIQTKSKAVAIVRYDMGTYFILFEDGTTKRVQP